MIDRYFLKHDVEWGIKCSCLHFKYKRKRATLNIYVRADPGVEFRQKDARCWGGDTVAECPRGGLPAVCSSCVFLLLR